MEDVLDVYQRPCDPECPVVCMDESNKQLSIEVREPIETGPGQVRCEDSEWKRKARLGDVGLNLAANAAEADNRRLTEEWLRRPVFGFYVERRF